MFVQSTDETWLAATRGIGLGTNQVHSQSGILMWEIED
jgi:hypothetical protein